jgi:lactoylglutathione lyase
MSPPSLRFGYTIAYVPDVSASLDFFERAFGLQRKFLHESGLYGELNTGTTTLAFAAHALGEMHFPSGFVKASQSITPLGMELALVADDVLQAHAHALACGAFELAAPEEKPWGQTVSYVRCPDGLLVELCSAMG